MADRTALARATEASEAPTPGYLYVDIAKNASNPVAAVEIAQYLTRRLQKNNHNVKFKCLKVIAKTATAGSGVQFKRAMSQNPEGVSAVKEALNYRGAPDPARGDEPSERVRSAAKEALDAIYSDTPSSSTVSNMGGMGGIGSNSYASGGGGGGGYNQGQNAGPPPGAHPHATRRMEGIGNPNFSDPRLAQSNQDVGNMTIGQIGAAVGDTIVGMIKDPLAKNMDVQPRHVQHAQHQQYGASSRPAYSGGGGGMSGAPSSSYGPPPGRAQLAQQTNNQWTMASNRGPDSYSGGTGASSSSAPGGVGGSWGSVATAVPASSGSVASQARAPSQPLPNRSGFAPPTGQGGTAVSDGSYEKSIIVELCPPGGMKAEPPPQKLASFRSTVPSLNPDLICPAILDTLEEGNPWIMRAKALCVMEVAIQQAERHDPNNNAYADFFHACAAEIEPLASHPRVAIKEPAKRVLKLLGIDIQAAGGAPPVSRSTRAPAPAPEPAVDLLGFDDGAAAPVPPPASAPPPPTQPPPPAPAAGVGSSMFGGMKVKSATPATSVPTPAPQPVQEESLLSEPPTASTEPSSSGLFGDVEVKQTATVATEEPTAATEAKEVAAATASTGSAFGFMNDASSAAPAAPKASFDPLLSPSPTNATPPMHQMSPAQMQAMLMQQQAMNQQAMMMQMQQMQISYQQQGGTAPPMMPPMMHSGGAGAGKPNVMHVSSHGTQATSSFSFLDAGGQPPKKEDTKFDFIKDTMKKG